MKLNILFLVTSIFFVSNSYSQAVRDTTVKEAKDYFADGDFKVASESYKVLMRGDTTNPLYPYRVGISYLYSNIDQKGKAIRFFKRASQLKGVDDDVLYQLARAYHVAYKFDDAIATFNKFMESSKDDELIEISKRQIEMCNYAKQATQKRLNIEIKNMGPDVNSPEPDYYPFVTQDESFLLFSTRRNKSNNGYTMVDGFKSGDIFILKNKRGKWKRAKSMGGAVSSARINQEVVGLSGDGQVLFVNNDSWEETGSVSMAGKKGRNFLKPEPLKGFVNVSGSEQITACINENKNVVYYASNNPNIENYGGYDLFKSNLLPDGTWGPSINLGPEINTQYDEFFPYLSKDEKLFRFSSNGHNSMGGSDIFTTTWNEDSLRWNTPQNIGYPINTPDDDMMISYSGNGRRAYISSSRKGGQGDLDLYEIIFNEVERKQSIITGKVYAMAPIDYNNYIDFYFYKNGDKTRKFTKEYLPSDTILWKFVKKKKTIIPPGKKYVVSLIFEKDSVLKKVSLKRLNTIDSTYVLKASRVMTLQDKNYKPLPKIKPKETEVLVPDAYITAMDNNLGDLIGNYTSHSKKATFVMTFSAGKYDVEVEAEGYKLYTKTISIMGLGSFQLMIKRNIVLEPEKPLAPIHYKEIKGLFDKK